MHDIVEYRQGYALGRGFDVLSMHMVGASVQGQQQPPSGGQASGYYLQLSTNQADIATKTAGASSSKVSAFLADIGKATLGVAGNFLLAAKWHRYSVFLYIQAWVTFGEERLTTPSLTQAASDMLARDKVGFRDSYGNAYIEGIQRGGNFIGIIEIHTTNSHEQQQVIAKLEQFSLRIKQGVELTTQSEFENGLDHAFSTHSTTVSVAQLGGGPVSPPNDIAELKASVAKFLQTPYDQAVPISARLQPYTSLGVLKSQLLDTEDVEEYLDNLSGEWAKTKSLAASLDHISAHPEEFQSADVAALRGEVDAAVREYDRLATMCLDRTLPSEPVPWAPGLELPARRLRMPDVEKQPYDNAKATLEAEPYVFVVDHEGVTESDSALWGRVHGTIPEKDKFVDRGREVIIRVYRKSPWHRG
jgi:hypothetical protein